MKKIFVTALLFALAISISAQTRRIGHRGHGGSMYTNGNSGDGNYGDPYFPPYHKVRRIDTIYTVYGTDSVMTVRDTTIIEWDTLRRINMILSPPEDVNQMGRICTRLTSKS